MKKKSKRNGQHKGGKKDEEADLVDKQPDNNEGEDNQDGESDSRSRRNRSLSSLFKRSRSREGRQRNRQSPSRDRPKSGTRDTSIEMADESETGVEKKVDPRAHLKRMTVREALVDSRKRGKSPSRSTVHLEKRILDNKFAQSSEQLSTSLPHILDQFPEPGVANKNLTPTSEVKTATLPRSGNRVRGRSEGNATECRKHYRNSHSNSSDYSTGKQTLPLDKRKYLIHRNSAGNDASADDNVHKVEVHQQCLSPHSSRDPSPYSQCAFMDEENRRESFKQFINLRENVSPFSSSLALAMASTSNEHPEEGTYRRFRSSRKRRQPVPSSNVPATSSGTNVMLPSYEEAMSAENVTPVGQAPREGKNDEFVSRLSKRDAFERQNKREHYKTPDESLVTDKSKSSLIKQPDHEKRDHNPLRSTYKSPRRFGATSSPKSNLTPNKNDSFKMQSKDSEPQKHNSAERKPMMNYQRQFKKDNNNSNHSQYASSPNNEIGAAIGARFETESQPEIVSVPYEGHLNIPKQSPVTVTKAVQKNTALKPESPKPEANISAAVKAFKSLLTKKRNKTTESNKDTVSLISETVDVENEEIIPNDNTGAKIEETAFTLARSDEDAHKLLVDTHNLLDSNGTEGQRMSTNEAETKECDFYGEENTSVHTDKNSSDAVGPVIAMGESCDNISINNSHNGSDPVPLINDCSGQSSDLNDHDEHQSGQQTIKDKAEADDMIEDDISKSKQKKKKKKSSKGKPDKSEKKRSKDRRKSKSKQENLPLEHIEDEITLIKEGEIKPNDSLISSGSKRRKLSKEERKANKQAKGRKKSKDSTRSLSIADAVIKVGRAASLSNITGSPHLVRERFQSGSNKLMKRSLSMEDIPARSEITELAEKKSKRKSPEVEHCKQQKDEKAKLSIGAIVAIRMKLSRMRKSKKRREELEIRSNAVEEEPKVENDADMASDDKRDSCDMNAAKVFYENEINVSKQTETENKDDGEQLISDDVISVDTEIEELARYKKKIHFQPYCEDTISEEERIKQRQRNTRLTSRRESKVRQRQRKVITCCKKFVAFMFSHIGLCSLVVAYCILGGFIFQKLEGDNELKKKKEMIKVREEYREKISRLAIESTLTRRSREEFRIEVDKLLLNYSIKIHRETKEAGWDGSDDSVELEQWSFPSSLLFAITVMTTIGYGHVAPKTDYGRIVTIAYAVLGIPLTLLCLTNIGDVMAKGFRLLYGKVCCGLCCILFRPSRRKRLQDPEKGIDPSEERMVMQEEEKSEEVINVPTSVCLLLMSAYVMLGTLLFSRWEGWDMVTGTYFCFITLSTIGFGDVVPGMNTTNWDTNEKLVLCALYLLFGLSLIAMCFNLVQEDVKAKCKWLGTKLGIIEKPVSSV